jgi:hypothetical protein
MEVLKENVDRILPFGDALRSILQHPSITKADVKGLLRIKGIFLEDYDDDVTFPLLTTCLLSPTEFDYIKEKLKTREDREKTIARTLEWNTDKKLINALPAAFNLQDIIKTNYPRYKVVGNPNFKMIDNDPNRIMLEFKCEASDFGQSWYRTKNEFKGQVIFEKVKINDNQIRLQIVHTSAETTDISDKVVKRLEKHFKEQSYMSPDKSIQRIQYKDFSNEERLAFLLSLTEGNDIFTFQQVAFADISPDNTLDLPDNINWMKLGRVNDLSINGDGVHEIDFIKRNEYHQYLESGVFEVHYRFSYHAASGSCRVSYGFPGYFFRRNRGIEFVVDIIKVVLDDDYSQSLSYSVRRYLLQEFEKFKTEKYTWLRAQTFSKSYTPTTKP